MKLYKHALFSGTYKAIEPIAGGIRFKVLETGEIRELTNHQVTRLLSEV